MVNQPSWHQLFELTQQMIRTAQNEEWAELHSLQQERDQLMQSLPGATAAEASLLREILHLNQMLTSLSGRQRDQLAGQLQQGQKKRRGISAYQAVTAQSH